MKNRWKTIIWIVGSVLLFSAQRSRDDDGRFFRDQGGVVHTSPIPEKHTQTFTRVSGGPTPAVHEEHIIQRQAGIQSNRTVEHRSTWHHHQNTSSWHPGYHFYKHHYHFYPYIYTSPIVYLSTGYTSFVFSGTTYYYDNGVFYQNMPQGYVAVAPPIGVIVRNLPAGAVQIVAGEEVYYTYNEVYYQPVPDGFQIVEPPS